MNAKYYETKLNTVRFWASQLAAKSYTTTGVTFLWFDDLDHLETMHQVLLAQGRTVLRYGLTLELVG
jgi:hypothetical protein